MISIRTHSRSLYVNSKTLGSSITEFEKEIIPWVDARIQSWIDTHPGHKLNPILKAIKRDTAFLISSPIEKLKSISDKKYERLYRVGRISKLEKNTITKVIGYQSFRSSKKSVKWAAALNIRSCPYCNSQFTLNLKKNKKENLRFHIDHFLPKSLYPQLSLSYFNLIPSCSACNTAKSDKIPRNIKNLYPFTADFDEFALFQLSKRSVINFLISGNPEELQIELQLRSGYSSNQYADALIEHDEMFSTHSLYKLFKLEAAEYIMKMIYYDKSRTDMLNNLQIVGRSLNSETVRYLLGDFIVKENILIRPLAKLRRDLQMDPVLKSIAASITS